MKRPLIPLTLVLLLCSPLVAAQQPISERRSAASDARIEVENVKGSIEVTGWKREEVEVSGSLGENAELQPLGDDPDHIRIRIRYPDGGGWFGGGRSGSSKLVVRVPEGSRLSVGSVSADIGIDGMRGELLDAESVSGTVAIGNSAATRISVETVSGSQQLRVDGSEARVETVSGDIDLEGRIDSRVVMEAVSGELRLMTPAALVEARFGVVSGDVDAQLALQPDARLQAESLSGDVTIRLPRSTSARLEISSFSGSIRSDAGKVIEAEFGPGSSLETTLGAGAGQISLESFSGDVRVSLE
jgi:hypothetical protein